MLQKDPTSILRILLLKRYLRRFLAQILSWALLFPLTLKEALDRKVTRTLGEEVNRNPPFTFDTIHPIDMIIGTYNKILLYFQLSDTIWCLIGFHGNYSYINDVTSGRHLGFKSFQISFKMTRK